MNSRWSIAALLLAAATPADAENWWLVDLSGNQFTFVDADSARVDGPHRRNVRIERIHATPGSDGIGRTMAEWDYHCADRTSDLLALSVWGPSGEMIEDTEVPLAEREVTPVVQGSIAGAVIDFACATSEARNDLPGAYNLGRDTGAVVDLVARLEALGIEEEDAVFLAAFDASVFPEHILETYLQVFRSGVPENRRRAAADLLGLTRW